MGSSKKDRDGILDLDVLINDVIKSGVDPSYFDLDISLPRAPNVIEFALSSTYLNTVLWAKQAEQAVKLFAEWCPNCSDPDFIQDVPVDAKMDEFRDRVMLLDKGVCPKCGQNRGDLFGDFPYELVSCLGQRSGKTALNGGVITPYIMHRLLMIPNPARYYGLMSNTFLYMTFVAITAEQAKQTLWIAFKGSLASSPWFQEYNKALEVQEKEKGLRRGTLLKVMDTYVWYGNKRISASYEAASTARSLRGRTRLSSSIDELGWFNANSTALQANASETYTALSNSLRTVRSAADILWDNGDYDVLSAYMLNIGSPSSQYDKIMSLLKDCEVDTRKVGFHWSSWESSPLITRKSLRSEELTDPNAFWRDYGAIPPLANSPFISNDKALYTCQTTDEPLFKTKPVYVEDKAGDGKFIAANLISCAKDKQTARIITCDAGEKGNHFCISMHHVQPSDQNVIHIYLDGIVEVAPEHNVEKNEIISIHFPTMFNIVMELCKNFNILVVAYDRWNCVTKDTYVYTTEGIKTIDSLYNDTYGVYPLIQNLATKNGVETTSLWGKLKNKQVYQVNLERCGIDIKGTKDHKLLSIDDKGNTCWFKIGELNSNDWVALDEPNVWAKELHTINYKNKRPNKVTCAICGKEFNALQNHIVSGVHNISWKDYLDKFNPMWTSVNTGKHDFVLPTKVTPEFARLLGYLTSEGWHGSEFGNSNKEVIDDYIYCFEQVFGIKPYILNRETKASTLCPNIKSTPFWKIRTPHVDIRKFLYDIGLDGLSRDKHIPDCILQSPKHVVKAYLQALFEGDGTVIVNEKRCDISYYSFSSILIKQLQVLLANFGIYGTVIKYKNNSKVQKYENNRLCIYESMAKKFLLTIGFITKDKNLNLLNIHDRREYLPIASLIKNWVLKNDKCYKESGGASGPLHHIKYKCPKTITKKQYLSIRPMMLHTDIDLVNRIDGLLRFHWFKIKTIEELGIEDVYDVTVPGSNSFIANGFVSHNSTGEIQRLRDFKVVAERYSPKWQDFIDFRNIVYSETYKMPRWEHKNLTDLDLTDHQAVSKAPYTHAAVQMATVREVGKKVTKPEYGEDDTFRATVLATRYLLDEKWQKKFLQAGFGNIRRQRGQLGSVRMKSTALGGSLGSPTAGTSSVAAARFNSQRR